MWGLTVENCFGDWNLELGVYLLFGVWILELVTVDVLAPVLGSRAFKCCEEYFTFQPKAHKCGPR